MATTFEYPPAFARHHPLQFAGNPAQLGRLRFEYHFFLTRLKIVVDSVFRSTDVDMEDIRRLNNEVVSPSVAWNTLTAI